MGITKIMLILIMILVLLLIIMISLSKIDHSGTKCSEKVYYFKAGNDYLKADRQMFRVLFTGEVANAYFYKDNREYSTKDYYKEYQEGTYQKVTKGNKTDYKCITNKN